MSNLAPYTTTAEMFTLDDFIHGRPAQILHATKSPKILIVQQHGNEELAPSVAHYIYTSRPDLAPHVDYVCGDPRAAAALSPAAEVGYDVNRAFGSKTAESPHAQELAQALLTYINKGSYDYVLDLHTTTNELEQFFIVPQKLSAAGKKIIASGSTTKVVAMPPLVTDKTLIGYVDRAIAFECNEAQARTPKVIQEITSMIEVLAGLTPAKQLTREIFYVDGLIPKTHDPGEDAQNFVLCSDGYYPVLLGKGKHSYRNDPTKDYACFGARRKETLVI